MKNSMDDVKNHLIAMMELLGDDEAMKDKGDAKIAIERARAMADVSEKIVDIEQTKIREREAQISTMRAAFDMGYVYKPDTIKLTEMKGLPNV